MATQSDLKPNAKGVRAIDKVLADLQKDAKRSAPINSAFLEEDVRGADVAGHCTRAMHQRLGWDEALRFDFIFLNEIYKSNIDAVLIHEVGHSIPQRLSGTFRNASYTIPLIGSLYPKTDPKDDGSFRYETDEIRLAEEARADSLVREAMRDDVLPYEKWEKFLNQRIYNFIYGDKWLDHAAVGLDELPSRAEVQAIYSASQKMDRLLDVARSSDSTEPTARTYWDRLMAAYDVVATKNVNILEQRHLSVVLQRIAKSGIRVSCEHVSLQYKAYCVSPKSAFKMAHAEKADKPMMAEGKPIQNPLVLMPNR